MSDDSAPSPRAPLWGALAICLSAFLWGLDGVVLTPRLSNLGVLFVVFLLHAVPFLVMQPFLFATYRRLRSLSVTEWSFLGLVAVSGGLLGTLAIVKALFLVNFNQLSVVVLLQKLQPLFAVLLAAVVLHERITSRFLVKALLAVGGAYLLAFGLRRPELAAGSSTAAAAWAAVAAAAFGSATVFGKRLLGALDFRQATFARYGATSLLALLLLVASGGGLPFADMTRQNWMLVLIIGFTTGSGAIFLYYFGLTRVRAVVSAICELCLPLAAILLDYRINGSRLDGWQWLGAAVLVGSIAWVSAGAGAQPPAAAGPAPEAVA